jgi:hypothetical protein
MAQSNKFENSMNERTQSIKLHQPQNKQTIESGNKRNF